MNLEYPIEVLQNQRTVIASAKSQAKVMPSFSKEIEAAYDTKLESLDQAIEMLSKPPIALAG